MYKLRSYDLFTCEKTIPTLLLIVVGHKDDTVLAEIFATLGKLAVRNEFCQRIVDLGGLDLMLNVLHNNVKNKVGAQSISNSFLPSTASCSKCHIHRSIKVNTATPEFSALIPL